MKGNENKYLKRFQIFFHILCQVSAASMIIYWIHRYSLNNDLCSIDFKTFLHEKEDVYPTMSLCFEDPFFERKLLFQNPQVNQSLYIDFLKGNHFDPNFVNIDYKSVTIDMSDYLVKDWMDDLNDLHFSTNFTPYDTNDVFSKSSTWIMHDHPHHCYTLKIPQNKQISRYGVILKTSVFPNSTRPSINGFKTLIHYPGQLMTSDSTIKYSWPSLDRQDKFIMRFKINGVEVLRRRTNGKQPCDNNWENYDDTILVNHLNKIGCRAPYQFPSKHFPVCNSQEKIEKAKNDFFLNTSDAIPPCKAIEKLYYTFEEGSSPLVEEGQFEIGIYFFDQQFKEILRTRYSIQNFWKFF